MLKQHLIADVKKLQSSVLDYVSAFGSTDMTWAWEEQGDNRQEFPVHWNRFSWLRDNIKHFFGKIWFMKLKRPAGRTQIRIEEQLSARSYIIRHIASLIRHRVRLSDVPKVTCKQLCQSLHCYFESYCRETSPIRQISTAIMDTDNVICESTLVTLIV